MGSDGGAAGQGCASSRYVGKFGNIYKLDIDDINAVDAYVWGFDPGTKRMAFTVFRPGDDGSLATYVESLHPDELWYVRAAGMVQHLRTWLSIMMPIGPESHLAVGIELPGVYNNRGITPVQLGDIRGMLMQLFVGTYGYAMCERFHLYADIRPTQIKKAMTGSGRASKAEVLRAARDRHNDTIDSQDVADSIGVAWVTLERLRLDLASDSG